MKERKIENFKDCVYGKYAHMKMDLVCKLPDKFISDLSNYLLIDYDNELYLVKSRYKPENGKYNMYYENILSLPFIELDSTDFEGCSDWISFNKRTEEIIMPLIKDEKNNIIFKEKNIWHW